MQLDEGRALTTSERVEELWLTIDSRSRPGLSMVPPSTTLISNNPTTFYNFQSAIHIIKVACRTSSLVAKRLGCCAATCSWGAYVMYGTSGYSGTHVVIKIRVHRGPVKRPMEVLLNPQDNHK